MLGSQRYHAGQLSQWIREVAISLLTKVVACFNTANDTMEGNKHNPLASFGNTAEDTDSKSHQSDGNTMDATNGNPPPLCGKVTNATNENSAPSHGNIGDWTSELLETVTAEINHAASSQKSMTYAATVNYDVSLRILSILIGFQMTLKPKLLRTNLTTCHWVILRLIQLLQRLLLWQYLNHNQEKPSFGSANIKCRKQQGRLLASIILLWGAVHVTFFVHVESLISLKKRPYFWDEDIHGIGYNNNDQHKKRKRNALSSIAVHLTFVSLTLRQKTKIWKKLRNKWKPYHSVSNIITN